VAGGGSAATWVSGEVFAIVSANAVFLMIPLTPIANVVMPRTEKY